jgi:hypothetical protein
VANTLNIPKIIARGLPTLRENAVTPKLITDYSFMVGGEGSKGNALTIPTGAAQATATITPSNTPPSNVDHVAGSKTLTINTHEGSYFHLTDQEMTQIDKDQSFVPLQMSEAFRSIANSIDANVLALYKDVYAASGTFGTTPFATTLAAWTGSGARKLLIDQLSPLGPWNAVLDTAAEGNLMGLSQVQAANTRGNDETMRTGIIGHVLGVNWHGNQSVPTHTCGTLSNGTGMLAKVNDASYTVGESTVDIDDTTLTGAVAVGDIFTVAGDTQQYTVTAVGTASGNALAGMAFSPTSQVAWANNAVITFKDGATSNPDHVANLVFHPGAFGIAFARPEGESLNPENQMVVTDPISGIPIRVKVTEEYYQRTYRLDVMYGVLTIRPEYAARIAG